jgi:hypothetical protein
MNKERHRFLQETYITLLSLVKKDENLFFKCRNSLEKLYGYYCNTYNPTIMERTKDFDVVEVYCHIAHNMLTHSIIADMLYISDLVLNTWNNTEKKKKQ